MREDINYLKELSRESYLKVNKGASLIGITSEIVQYCKSISVEESRYTIEGLETIIKDTKNNQKYVMLIKSI